MARLNNISVNLDAFLDMLSVTEGTSTSKFTKDNGYDIIVGGIDSPNRFDSYARHPDIRVNVNGKGLYSTAAGRYQVLSKYAKHYLALLKLKDFSPISQDLIAIQQIREFRGLPLIEAGKIEEAIGILNPLWASLPGNSYGQHQFTLKRCIEIYLQKGGKLWNGSLHYSDIGASTSPAELPLSSHPSLVTPPENEKAETKPEQKPQSNKLMQLLNALIRMFKKNPKS